MKKFLTLLLGILMVFSLAACSKEANDPPKDENPVSDTKEEVTLKISMWGDESRKERYLTMLEPFCAENNCKVEIELIALSEYYTKLAAQFGAGTAPDVIWVADGNDATFIQAGRVADLYDTLSSDPGYDLGDFYESAIYQTDYKDEGKIYGVPFSFGARPIYYNKTLFENAGLKTPREYFEEGAWTYDVMFDLAREIYKYDSTKIGLKLWCVGQTENILQMFADMLPAYGASILSADSTEFTWNSEGGIEVFNKVFNAMKDGSHAQPGDDIAFVSGNVAMARETYSYMSMLANETLDFEWDIVPQPVGPLGDAAPLYTGYAFWTVNDDSANKQLAMDLVKFVSNPENQLAFCKTFLVPRSSVMNSKEVTDLGNGYPSPETIKECFVTPVEIHGLWTDTGTAGMAQLMQALLENTQLIWADAVSVEDGMAMMKEAVAPYLNEK